MLQESKMKTAMRAALVSLLVAVPAISFAQSANNAPLTRAEVKQQLVDLESVGYNPARVRDANYPEEVQAAMQRLSEKQANEARVAQSSYGGSPAQGGESGGPSSAR
jgi:ABC-type sulfate transport system substrate-binding protein